MSAAIGLFAAAAMASFSAIVVVLPTPGLSAMTLVAGHRYEIAVALSASTVPLTLGGTILTVRAARSDTSPSDPNE